MYFIKRITLLTIALTLGACSVAPPKYAPSYKNVQVLKEANQPVEVAPFKGVNTSVGAITIRASPLSSPYGKDLVHYIQTALESEFTKAGLLKKGSSTKLTAVIEENDLDTSSDFSVGKGVLKAKFKVTKQGNAVYNKSISVTSSWESSFIGAIAIPGAAEAYPKLVEKLLKKLYSDKSFINSLKG